MGLGDDEIIDVQRVIVLGVGDGAFQSLLHLDRTALARKFEIGERPVDFLAANELGEKIELLRRDANHARDALGLVVLQRARELFLAHDQDLFAFLSDAWPWNVRVGENSPNLWPIMSSVTLTGMCLCPL